MDTFS